MAKKKKYHEVNVFFTYKGKKHEAGSKIYLSDKEKEVLISKNLIKWK